MILACALSIRIWAGSSATPMVKAAFSAANSAPMAVNGSTVLALKPTFAAFSAASAAAAAAAASAAPTASPGTAEPTPLAGSAPAKPAAKAAAVLFAVVTAVSAALAATFALLALLTAASRITWMLKNSFASMVPRATNNGRVVQRCSHSIHVWVTEGTCLPCGGQRGDDLNVGCTHNQCGLQGGQRRKNRRRTDHIAGDQRRRCFSRVAGRATVDVERRLNHCTLRGVQQSVLSRVVRLGTRSRRGGSLRLGQVGVQQRITRREISQRMCSRVGGRPSHCRQHQRIRRGDGVGTNRRLVGGGQRDGLRVGQGTGCQGSDDTGLDLSLGRLDVQTGRRSRRVIPLKRPA